MLTVWLGSIGLSGAWVWTASGRRLRAAELLAFAVRDPLLWDGLPGTGSFQVPFSEPDGAVSRLSESSFAVTESIYHSK